MIRGNKGFTLTEVIIVIIIVGILSGLALPRYFRVVERSRSAEAVTWLNALRKSQIRFFAENSVYVQAPAGGANFDLLDIEDPNDVPAANRFYQYVLVGTAAELVRAERLATVPAEQYSIRMDEDGAMCCVPGTSTRCDDIQMVTCP